MAAQLIALVLALVAGAFCLGAMAERVRMRPRRSTIDLKVARDEIEEMIAG